MGVLDQVEQVSVKNPTDRYYEFKGKSDGFVHYVKETNTNEVVMPLSFAFLTTRNEVSGYHKRSKSGIYSNSLSKNEIMSGKTPFSVYSSKKDSSGNSLLGTGLWKDIKEQVGKAGGKFTKVVYGYQFGVGIIKINLVGTAISEFGTFEDDNKADNAVFLNLNECKSTRKQEQDDDYTRPVFSLGKKLTEKQRAEQDEAFEKLMEYLNSKNKSKDQPDQADENLEDELAPPVMVGAEDDLPF